MFEPWPIDDWPHSHASRGVNQCRLKFAAFEFSARLGCLTWVVFASLFLAPQIAQAEVSDSRRNATCPCETDSAAPKSVLQVQGSYLQQGAEATIQTRASFLKPLNQNSQVGGTLEFIEGNNLAGSQEGLRLPELYYSTSLPQNPNVNFTVGQTDLTSHFDRNSFAKDGTTHFFHPALQSNPALVAAGLSSRPAAIARWRPTDGLMAKAGVFSSDESLGGFSPNGAVAEVGVRTGNTLIRATYITGQDRGADTGFQEIYSLTREGGQTGLKSGDREQALGINAETFFSNSKIGAFARYGWYHNAGVGESAQNYSVGLNALDVFRDQDRLGVAYGHGLSNERLRRQQGRPVPNVAEAFYDARITPHLRAGVVLQQRNNFSETVAGFRVKASYNISPIKKRFQ